MAIAGFLLVCFVMWWMLDDIRDESRQAKEEIKKIRETLDEIKKKLVS
jgi:hypothetical protein